MEVVEDETNTWVVSGSVDGTIRKWNGHTGMVGVSKPDVNPIRCSLDLAGWWRLECWRQHHTMSHETPFGVNLSHPLPPFSLFNFSSGPPPTSPPSLFPSGELLLTLRGQRSIWCLQVEAPFVFSGSKDGTVRQWNFYTGALIREYDTAAKVGQVSPFVLP